MAFEITSSVTTPVINADTLTITGGAAVPVSGIRQDADTPPVADGQPHPFVFNPTGRLKVSTLPAATAPAVMSISATQASINTPVANATAFCDVRRQSNVTMYCTGTFAAINCAFEASIDSTNGTDGFWFGIQAVRTNANTIETATGSLSAAPAYAWEMSANGYNYVRVRATARTSGTQVWTIMPGAYATEPIPAAQVTATQPISGAVTLVSTTISGGQTAQGVAVGGNPVVIGSRSSTANPSAVTDGQTNRIRLNKIGDVVVQQFQVRDLHSRATVTLTTTTETTLVAAVASTFNDIISFSFFNSSATGTTLTLRDTTTGSDVWTLYLPATSAGQMTLPAPLKQSTVNTNWTVQLGTAVTSVYVNCQYVAMI